MSQADLERFVSDLKTNVELRTELSGHASGIGSVVEFAGGKGYDIAPQEARDYIQAQTTNDLSDAQLDAISGGKGHHSAVTQVAAVQTGVAASTIDVAAEVVAAAVIILT